MGDKRVTIGIAIVLGLLVIAGIWYMQRPPAPQQVTALTPEAKAYVRNLALSDVTMKATDSYAGQTVIEIEGKIANNGTRPVKSVEVYCIFYDSYGQLVRRAREPIVRPTGGVLAPGQTRAFRLPFDDVPESWNKQMPQLVIASIVFG
ncbi:MAG TPA: FxLYD domain-containing protein [Bryobacteraceae bacterium]|nr:FxLYD domain-containing protein [Bryobacteraceae bacterium]